VRGDENAGRIAVIECVPAHVRAPVADEHLPAGCGQTFCHHAACESDSDDEVVEARLAPTVRHHLGPSRPALGHRCLDQPLHLAERRVPGHVCELGGGGAQLGVAATF
jgi:hypothetical protein